MISLFTKKVCTVKLMLLLFALTFTLSAEKLYVYYPSSIKPLVIQEQLTAACPGVEITVFGRYQDFATMFTQAPPDAFIAKTELGKKFSADYSISLSGVRNGVSTEKYVLVSVDVPLDPKSLNETIVVGALDFMSRNDMNSFLQELTGVQPKVKRVAKVEDLLPVLSFNMGKAIIISDFDAEDMKKKSNLKFVSTPLSDKAYGIVSLSVKKGGSSAKIVESVKKLKSVMGIEKWQ